GQQRLALECLHALRKQPDARCFGGRRTRRPARAARKRALHFGWLHHVARSEQQRPLDDVAQLAHVARPRIPRQRLQRLSRKVARLPIVLLGKLPHKMFGERECPRAARARAAAPAETRTRDDTGPRGTCLAEPAPPDCDAWPPPRARPPQSAYRRPRARFRPPRARAAAWPASASAYRRSRPEKACRDAPARIFPRGAPPRR